MSTPTLTTSRVAAARAALALLIEAVKAAQAPGADKYDAEVLAIRLAEAEQVYETTRPGCRAQEAA